MDIKVKEILGDYALVSGDKELHTHSSAEYCYMSDHPFGTEAWPVRFGTLSEAEAYLASNLQLKKGFDGDLPE